MPGEARHWNCRHNNKSIGLQYVSACVHSGWWCVFLSSSKHSRGLGNERLQMLTQTCFSSLWQIGKWWASEGTQIFPISETSQDAGLLLLSVLCRWNACAAAPNARWNCEKYQTIMRGRCEVCEITALKPDLHLFLLSQFHSINYLITFALSTGHVSSKL